MKRAAEDRRIMLRRVRQDIDQHRNSGSGKLPVDAPDLCNCTPGKFRKKRPLGCYKGRGCICRLGNLEPTRQERIVLLEEREWRRDASIL